MLLTDSIVKLKGVGERTAKLYEKLGIFTPFDLLYHIPRNYIDYSKPVPISDAVVNENNVVRGMVIKKFPEIYNILAGEAEIRM
mgnify:CR=1 FL=1